MSVSNRATKEAALNSPLTYAFTDGGYQRVSILPMPTSGQPDNCNPPPNMPHMSTHALMPPDPENGPETFYWSTKGNVWITLNPYSKRVGYLPEYLSRNGWKYLQRVA